MKKIIGWLCLVVLTFGCSDDNTVLVEEPLNDGTYFHFKVNGTDIPFIQGGQYDLSNRGQVNVGANRIEVFIEYGFNNGSLFGGLHRFDLIFLPDGRLINVEQESTMLTQNGFTIRYKNYYNFPSNYFNVNIISNDIERKRLKATFSGKLYFNQFSFESESIDVEGDFDIIYQAEIPSPEHQIQIAGVQQYCKSKLNGADWVALFESPYGTFTASDPYKIDIQFPISATPTIYNLTPGGSTNYLKFYKFNTITKVFDEYEVTGSVSYTYREFHGANRYSFIGTYSFTAVNPNNSSDIIQVTDGTFRSFKQY